MGNGAEQTDERPVGDETYRIQRYRPRIEGLFARIERWTNPAEPGDTLLAIHFPRQCHYLVWENRR